MCVSPCWWYKIFNSIIPEKCSESVKCFVFLTLRLIIKYGQDTHFLIYWVSNLTFFLSQPIETLTHTHTQRTLCWAVVTVIGVKISCVHWVEQHCKTLLKTKPKPPFLLITPSSPGAEVCIHVLRSLGPTTLSAGGRWESPDLHVANDSLCLPFRSSISSRSWIISRTE